MPIAAPHQLCLIVDDDEDILLAARLALRPLFAEIATTPSPAEALTIVAARGPDVVMLDANFARGATDGAEGFRWLDRILEQDPAAVVVMITAHGGVQIAVEAMKRGATDFVSKPWANERLLATVRTAASLRASRRDAGIERGKAQTIAAPQGETPLLSRSSAMARVQSLIEKAGPTDANVLILGENGTGKELVARALHRHSRRANQV
nr:response regulator [Pseudomonadota bacterium]